MIAASEVLLAAFLLTGPVVAGQELSSVSFTLDFPGQDPPHYSVTVKADGSGEYSEPNIAPITFQLSAASGARWMAAGKSCASGSTVTELQKVAFSGQKTIVVRYGDAGHTCTWSAPREGAANDLIHQAEAVAETIQFGQIFIRDMRFDRIRLDRDMDNWQHMLKSGAASEPQAIAPVLETLRNDPQVLAKVRRAAAESLAVGQKR